MQVGKEQNKGPLFCAFRLLLDVVQVGCSLKKFSGSCCRLAQQAEGVVRCPLNLGGGDSSTDNSIWQHN